MSILPFQAVKSPNKKSQLSFPFMLVTFLLILVIGSSVQAAQLKKPKPKIPKGNIYTNPLVYSWKSVNNADAYILQVRKGGQIVSTEVTTAIDANCNQSEATHCQIVNQEILTKGRYRWRVRAKAGEQTGRWSQYKTFKVKTPTAVKTVSPKGVQNNTNLNFIWRHKKMQLIMI